jgi:phage-related tail protein
VALLVAAVPMQAAGVPRRARQDPGTVQGTALAADRSPLQNHTVQLRNLQTGQLAGSMTTLAGGQFAFAGIAPGNYIVELLNAAGNIIGATAPIAVTAGATTAVTVIATAAGTLGAAATAGGFSLFGLGPAASVVIIGATVVGITAAIVATREDASPSR